MSRNVFLSTVVIFALPAAAFAQDNTGARDNTTDIVVTATRQSTLLSKTPVTMSALTAESLRNAGITDPRSLTNAIPNFALTESSDAVRISIRGVTSSDTSEKGDPSAAFLIDGIYIARPSDMQSSLYDLERVEVLRGPQGTLYGRNTTAGVVNIISARPTDQFSASLDGSYGSLHSANLTGMVNVPVAAGLGVRAAVNYQRQDAYYTLTTPGAYSINPFRDILSARLSFGGTALDDRLNFVIRGDFTQTKGTGVNGNFVTLDRFYTNTGVVGVDPIYVNHGADYQRQLTVTPSFPSRRDNKNYGVMGEFTYDFGPIQATYLGSYRRTERDDVRDSVLFGGLNNPAAFAGRFVQNSHELRLAFGKGQPLHGQIGGYYFREKSHLEFDLFNPLAGFVVAGASNFAFPQGPVINESKAGFGQLTYDVTPALHVTAGVRYTQDHKSRNGATIVDFTSLANAPSNFVCNSPSTLANGSTRCVLNQNVAARTFNKTIWKIGVDYDVPNLGLVYATVSTGYKAGGFNDGCITGQGVGCALPASALYYRPETLTNYEAGLKFKISREFRMNIAAFHYDYKNLQLSQTTFVNRVVQALISNATSAKVDGIEIESTLQPTKNDHVDLGFTYTNARYGTFLPDPVNHPNLSFAGKELDHAPKYAVTAGYTHTIELGSNGKIDLSARTRLSAAYYMIDLNNLSQFRQPSFTKTDLTVTYTAPDDRWYIQGYAKNLENNITVASASTGIGAGVNIEEPRTFGARAGVKF